MQRRGAQVSLKARKEAARKRAEDFRDVIDDIRSRGFTTLQSMADELNGLGYRTARGKDWTRMAVKRVVDRLSEKDDEGHTISA